MVGAFPDETRSVTSVPSCAVLPARRGLATTVPSGCSERTSSIRDEKLASARICWAASEPRPVTSGTSPVAGGGGVGKLRTGMPAEIAVM